MIWLASYPKSGNTWSRILIQSYLRGGDPVAINRIRGTEYATSNGLFAKVTGFRSRHLAPSELDGTRHAFFVEMGLTADRTKLFKTHENNLPLASGGRLYPLNPGQRAVVLVRHPYDVVVSYGHYSQGASPDFDRTIDNLNNPDHVLQAEPRGRFNEFVGDWSGHARSWIDGDPRYLVVVRYEDLLRDAERELRRMLRIVTPGATPETEAVRSAVKAASFEELQRQEADAGFIERPRTAESFFRSGRAGSWREALTEAQCRRIRDHHHEMMTRLGYNEDGSIRFGLSELEEVPA